jgi:hypothetical protein
MTIEDAIYEAEAIDCVLTAMRDRTIGQIGFNVLAEEYIGPHYIRILEDGIADETYIHEDQNDVCWWFYRPEILKSAQHFDDCLNTGYGKEQADCVLQWADGCVPTPEESCPE